MTPHDKAQQGLAPIKDAVLEIVRASPDGLRNVDVERTLGIESSRGQDHRGWLCWEVLSLLMNDGKLIKVGRRYRLPT